MPGCGGPVSVELECQPLDYSEWGDEWCCNIAGYAIENAPADACDAGESLLWVDTMNPITDEPVCAADCP